MASISFDGYRRQWPRLGGVLAMAVGGATTLAAAKLSRPQLFSALNLGALFAHQYEEYVDPGWFPGQFNHGLFKSDQPRNYPLNADCNVGRVSAFSPGAGTLRYCPMLVLHVRARGAASRHSRGFTELLEPRPIAYAFHARMIGCSLPYGMSGW